jgi:hypothetical protein
VLLRMIAVLGGIAVLLSMAFSVWRSGAIQSWLTTAPSQPQEIVFDNGSVRDLPGPAASVPTRTAALSAPGVMRKCVRGERVTYSNLTCPPGFRERPVSAEGVSVVPAVRNPAGSNQQPTAAPHERMRDALDLKRDEKLRQRMIDQAIEAEAR